MKRGEKKVIILDYTRHILLYSLKNIPKKYIVKEYASWFNKRIAFLLRFSQDKDFREYWKKLGKISGFREVDSSSSTVIKKCEEMPIIFSSDNLYLFIKGIVTDDIERLAEYDIYTQTLYMNFLELFASYSEKEKIIETVKKLKGEKNFTYRLLTL